MKSLAKTIRRALTSTATKPRKRRCPSMEQLENKDLFATLLLVDFDGASQSEISTLCGQVTCNSGLKNSTSGAPSFLGTFSALNSNYSRYSFLDYDGNGRLDNADGEIAARRILDRVEEDFSPFNLRVLRQDSTSAAWPMMRDNSGSDALIVVSRSFGAGGQAPLDVGNRVDNAGWATGGVALAQTLADLGWRGGDGGNAFVNAMANIISHEAAHTFGVEHVDTSVHPSAISLMTPSVGVQNLNFPDQNLTIVTGSQQNAFRYLQTTLGVSPDPWIYVLQPGILAMNGDEQSNQGYVYRNSTGDWTAYLSGYGTAHVDPSSSPDINSVNPFTQEIVLILFWGNDGNDTFRVYSGINTVNYAFGGDGDDVLMGGDGTDYLYGQNNNDVLVGNDGNDTLDGGSGRDLLIGGEGIDYLNGGSYEDILIGGRTSYDSSSYALGRIMAEWASSVSQSTRISRITGTSSGGLNGSYRLNASTVHDDGDGDTIYGGTSADWFFLALGDSYVDWSSERTTWS